MENTTLGIFILDAYFQRKNRSVHSNAIKQAHCRKFTSYQPEKLVLSLLNQVNTPINPLSVRARKRLLHEFKGPSNCQEFLRDWIWIDLLNHIYECTKIAKHKEQLWRNQKLSFYYLVHDDTRKRRNMNDNHWATFLE